MLTPDSRLRDFPSLAGMAYLNTAAESIPPVCVGAALREYWEHKCLGMAGREPHFARVERCREISARWIGLQTEEVSFCSCSSEAYNLLASALNLQTDDEVVVTDLDFPAGATPWMAGGVPAKARVWRSADGALRVEDLEKLLNERTRLVQVSLVSFYNGHRVDWTLLRGMVRERAPQALISVDVTQALGRVALDCADADIIISSTHKWTLGIHGGCIVGIPARNTEKLTTRAGGWFHIRNAFDADRFESVRVKPGAASFSVGMPNFAALYALDASLRYLEGVGIDAISAHADPLVKQAREGLEELGLKWMTSYDARLPTGILAFQHPRSTDLHAALLRENVHVMHHAGRIRVAIHGYNTTEDVERLVAVLREAV